MSNEKLPIKFFAPREVDEQRVEGAGSKELPSGVLSGNELEERAALLIDDLSAFRDGLVSKVKTNSPIPSVFVAEISEKFSAKSHRQEIVDLFSYKKSNNVIGMSESNELIVKMGSVAQIDALSAKLKKHDDNKYAISCIQSLRPYRPFMASEDGEINYKAKLLNYQSHDLNENMQRIFEKYLCDEKIAYKKTMYTPTEAVFKLQSITPSQLDSICKNEVTEALFSIEPMPQYSVSLDSVARESKVKVKQPEENESYLTVGILDSGIAKIPQLAPWLEDDKFCVYPESDIDNEHGTFVSGIALYGDECEGQDWVGHKGFRLFDATVFPDVSKEGLEEDDLIANIKEAVSANAHRIKIWNLSISINREIRDERFSDFAIALDSLQEEYDVLICKSAGNCKNFATNHPKGRINEGADSVRSIVVGSVAHKKSEYDYADIDNPSPFSRVGPGPEFIIKPEIAHYGGNAGIDETGQITVSGVTSFSPSGEMVQSAGTSFSTPRIASLAAGITHELAEEFDPLLIRALMVHSSNYSSGLRVPQVERTKQLGFGVPQRVDEIIFNPPNEATLILRDDLAKGEYIDIMEFPMPPSLIKNGVYTGQVIVTLVYDPILDASQGVEYCQSNIDVKFGSYDTKYERDISKKNILNPVGRTSSQNLLLPTVYSKRRLKSADSDFALRERLLIQYADKYYPVKKYAVDFDEMTEGNKLKYLSADRNWYLYLRGLYRDHIERKAVANFEQLSQEFCMILTIRDPSGQAPVYDEVTQKLDEYVFLHRNIKLSQNISISL